MEEKRYSVEMENVTVIRDEVQILTDITIRFRESETTVVMGPSGCGKSTVLKVAAGLAPPDEGKVLIQGRDVGTIPDRELSALRKSHGFVFQDAALWQNKTVFQNLSLPLEFHFRSFSPDEIRRRVETALRIAGYRDSNSLRPVQLSAGERKMVSFARAIITEPGLIFMDDPTISVDHEGIEKLMKVIRELKEQKKTLIIATHSAELTSIVADNLVLIKGGKVLVQGTFDEVVRNKNREVVNILSDVLSQSSTYAGDILDLMDD